MSPVPTPMTKREVAEVAIRNAIETGQYKPGQIISQRRIQEDLGLSVTPIREAVLVLSGNGIVERHQHHSIKVSEIDSARLEEIFEVRQMLEQEAVRLAAKHRSDMLIAQMRRVNKSLEAQIEAPEPAEVNHLDRQLHALIFNASDNAALVWTIDRVKSSFPMYALWNEPGRIETSVAEHWRLIDAIDAGDPEAAARAQHDHLANGLRSTITYLERLI